MTAFYSRKNQVKQHQRAVNYPVIYVLDGNKEAYKIMIH
jgi:predicted alpha/beta superfamily hydrolase